MSRANQETLGSRTLKKFLYEFVLIVLKGCCVKKNYWPLTISRDINWNENCLMNVSRSSLSMSEKSGPSLSSGLSRSLGAFYSLQVLCTFSLWCLKLQKMSPKRRLHLIVFERRRETLGRRISRSHDSIPVSQNGDFPSKRDF